MALDISRVVRGAPVQANPAQSAPAHTPPARTAPAPAAPAHTPPAETAPAHTSPLTLGEPEELRRAWADGPALAVTIHDVEPRTFPRVREIREWLNARGVDRTTLAVIPAADLHPVGTRSPLLASWLRAQVARGDAIAQHGLRHRGTGAEFTNLGAEESHGRVHAGLTLLREVELDPHGFIAPAYGYTPALRRVLRESFDWFGERARVQGTERSLRAPALRLGTTSRVTRILSPSAARLRAPLCGALMRLDIHPADFDLIRHIETIDQIVGGAADRQVITYDDVFRP